MNEQSPLPRNTHAIDARRLEVQAEDIADALASLHGIEVERILHSPEEVLNRQRERGRLEERRRRLAKLYELGELAEADYMRRRDEVNAALARLSIHETPSIKRTKQILESVREFPWLMASAEKKAAVLQSIAEAFFVDPVNDSIAAVAPKPELRLFMRDRVYIKRVPTGWPLNRDGSIDRERPDDWDIEFIIAPGERPGRSLPMRRLRRKV
jgi:hypothetical protein